MTNGTDAHLELKNEIQAIYGFIHIATHGRWQQIVDEQLALLRSSGLYERTAKLFIGIVGPQCDGLKISDPKIEVVYRSQDIHEFEYPTLRHLHTFCQANSCLVYYFHTKGVFHDSLETTDWRRYLEYFVIERFDDCIRALQDSDICGVNWQERPWPHFSGNFWWARSTYVAKLPSVEELTPERNNWNLEARHQCEKWIGVNPSVRAATLYQSSLDHYRLRFPRDRYSDCYKNSNAFSTAEALPPLPRIAVIFDDFTRRDTTGVYCLRALKQLTRVAHFRPCDMRTIARSAFDLFLFIDDGMDYELPEHLRPAAFWAIDTHLTPARVIQKAAAADFSFAAQRAGVALLKDRGTNCVGWLPLACDPEIHAKFDVAKELDVSFIAHMVTPERKALADLIKAAFPRSFVGQQYFTEMARTYSASKIVINLSIKDDINMRIFEALSCGSLLITNDLRNGGQDKLFSVGDHLVTYTDNDELISKIQYFITHDEERERIASAGQTLVRKHHTYLARMETIIAEISRRSPCAPFGSNASTYFQRDREKYSLTSIVIPVHNQITYTKQCIESIRRHTLAPFELILVDNASCDGTPEYFKEVPDVRAIQIGENAGFSAAANKGIAACKGSQIVILNNETIVTAGWLEAMLRVMDDDPCVGLVGPCTNSSPGPQKVKLSYDNLADLDRAAEEHCQEQRRRREIASVLVGFCLLIHRRVIERIGPFDESFGIGTYEDYDFCQRALNAGFRLVIARDSYVHHFGSVTMAADGVDLLRLLKGNEALYRSKLETGARWKPGKGPKEFPQTSIIIITMNGLDFTKRCLDSIERFTHRDYEVIVVDNASNDGTPDYLRSLGHVILIENKTNVGFPAAVNLGIRRARGREILLLNNDVIVTPAWLELLRRALYSFDDIGLVGPCSNEVSGLQRIDATYSDASGIPPFAQEYSNRNARQIQETSRLVGFCILIRKSVVERIGLFDERFGIGNFEDDDYCRRAIIAGFRLLIARDCFVHHFGSATFKASGVPYNELLQQNRKLFTEKWDRESKDLEGGAAIRADGRLCQQTSVRISLCMIVRDSLRTLKACLESIRPWVDEMIVIDTGSLDETPQVARAMGAQVRTFRWCDDFAAARNESLRLARGEWIFWMDSDDTIDDINGQQLRNLVDRNHDPSIMGFVLQVRCPSPTSNDAYSTPTVVDHVKVFRNHPTIRFSGRIHEQVLPSIRRLGGQIEWTNIFVSHSGSDMTPEGRARKHDRDLRLLDLELRDGPDNTFTLFNIGMTLLDMQKADEALAPLCRSLQLANPGDSHLRKLYALLTQAYSELGRKETALRTCDQGLLVHPTDPELLFRRGVLLQSLGRFDESESCFNALVNSRSNDHFSSIDNGIFGIKVWHNLAIVYHELQRFEEEAKAWKRVLDFGVDNQIAWIGLLDSLTSAKDIRGLDEIARSLNKELIDIKIVAQSRSNLLSGKASRALENLEQAVEVSRSSFVLRELCDTSIRCGEFILAERHLTQLAEQLPSDASVQHNLAIVLLQNSKFAEAIAAAKISLRFRPQHPPTMQLLSKAESALQSGKSDEDAQPLNFPPNAGSTRPIYGFMHVALINHWREIVDEQILKMKVSGLWYKAERIFVGLVGGQKNDFDYSDTKIVVAFHNPDLTVDEQSTLAYLYDFCAKAACFVFYIHTKGVVRRGIGQEQWRRSMEHFIITRHEDCLKELTKKDICGINWSDRSGWCRFFGGNFWWATSEYIRTLPKVSELKPRTGEDSVRYSCERWIGENPSVRAACLFDSRTDHYANQPLPRSRYAALHEVDVANDIFRCPSAWRGLENRFQDLLEPLAPIHNIVEIGVMYGFSLFCFARSVPSAQILGIDPYDHMPLKLRQRYSQLRNEGNIGTPDAAEWVERYMTQFPNVRLLKLTGAEAFAHVQTMIDVIHLDAVPSYDDISEEFYRWLPMLRPGGCVLFHDTRSFGDEVGRFFSELPGRKVEITEFHGLGAWYRDG